MSDEHEHDPYDGSINPTRPKQPAQRVGDEPTMVKCPTCAAVEVSKLGCRTCAGAGFITYEAYFKLTDRCPTCLGSGRVTKEQSDALEDDAKKKEAEK